MSEHKELRECVRELSKGVDFNIACSRMTQGAEALYRNLVWWHFLPDETLFDRVHIIGIAGALRLTTDKVNDLLAVAGFEPLKEGEAADGTAIDDLERRIAALEEAVAELNKVIAAIREGLQYPIPSVEEMKRMFPHGLDSTS